MADQWYIARGGKKTGPYSSAQMSQMVGSGELLPGDMVLQEGATHWGPASRSQEFFPPTSMTPAPPPINPVASERRAAPPTPVQEEPVPVPRIAEQHVTGVPVAEAAEWHYIVNGQQSGPVSWRQLRQLAASGQLGPRDKVWKDGMPSWTTARSIPNMAPPRRESSPPPKSITPVVAEVKAETLKRHEDIASLKKRVADAHELLNYRLPLSAIIIIMAFVALPWIGVIGSAFVTAVVVSAFFLRREYVSGLLPPVIGMIVVVSFALLLGVFGMVGVFAFDTRMPARNTFLLAMTLMQNGLATLCLAQTLRANRRYALTVLGALLALTSWGWLLFTTIPIVVSLPGTLAGMVVGFWGLMALKNQEVRAKFPNKWLPAEDVWQRFSAPAIAASVGGGALVVMFFLVIVWWLTTGGKKPDFSKVDYSKGPRGEKLETREKERTGGGLPLIAEGFVDEKGEFVEHGRVISTDAEGQLRQETFFLAGKRHGSWREWYASGQIGDEGYYVNGVRAGPYTKWDESGKKILEVTFDKGRLIYDHKRQPRAGFVTALNFIQNRNPPDRFLYFCNRCTLREFIEMLGEPDKEVAGGDALTRYWIYQCSDGKLTMRVDSDGFAINSLDRNMNLVGEDNFPSVLGSGTTHRMSYQEFRRQLATMGRGGTLPSLFYVCNDSNQFFRTFGLPDSSRDWKGGWEHQYSFKDGSKWFKLAQAGREVVVSEK